MTVKPYRSAIAWVVLLVYAAIVLSILPYHQPWHDEAHFWLIGRDLTLGQMLGHQMAYEGSPPLRYLMVMALAKSGLPYISLGVLNALTAIATAAVILFLSPFAMWQRAVVSLSIYQLYMYGVVWRMYTLAGLLLLLVAYLYRSRFQRPLLYAACVALLANSCLQMLGVSLLLFGEFIYTGVRGTEKNNQTGVAGKSVPNREKAAWLIMAIFIISAICVLIQPADINFPGAFPIFYPRAILELFSAPFVFGIYDNPFNRDSPWHLSVALPCLAAFLLLCWELRGNWRALGLVLLTLLGWSYLFTFKNRPNVYHVGLMFYVVLAALWISWNPAPAPGARRGARKLKRIGALIFFGAQALTIIGAAQSIALEIKEPFSNAGDAAEYISRIQGNPVIAEYTQGRDEAILPYLPNLRFWGVEGRNFGTVGFSRDYAAIGDVPTLLSIIARNLPPPPPWILLSGEMPWPKYYGYELIYESPRPAWGLNNEAYWIYCPIGANHPPVEISPLPMDVLLNGYPYHPFDAKYFLEFLN